MLPHIAKVERMDFVLQDDFSVMTKAGGWGGGGWGRRVNLGRIMSLLSSLFLE